MSKTKPIENPKATLDEIATRTEILADKINVLTNAIAEDYFSENIDAEFGKVAILGNFDYYRIMADVVRDYVIDLKETASELIAISDCVFDILKNIEEKGATANA